MLTFRVSVNYIRTKTQSVNVTQLFLLLLTKLLISLKGDAYSDATISKKVSKNIIFFVEKGVSQIADDSV